MQVGEFISNHCGNETRYAQNKLFGEQDMVFGVWSLKTCIAKRQIQDICMTYMFYFLLQFGRFVKCTHTKCSALQVIIEC